MTQWMDITLVFITHKDTGRNVCSVLVLSALNRCHFDYCADFHTDSARVFAYLTKPVRRLVNCHQSKNGRGGHMAIFLFYFYFVFAFFPQAAGLHRWYRVHDVSCSACHTGEEFARHKHTQTSAFLCRYLKGLNLAARTNGIQPPLLQLIKLLTSQRAKNLLFEKDLNLKEKLKHMW